jgi:hypothetical protein
MIKKLKQFFETQTSLLQKKAGVFKEENIECSIDEQIVDCKDLDEDPYVGVPAPILTPHDDWFEDPPKTEMQMEYEHINDDPHDGWWLRPEWQDDKSNEPDNIHQLMYEIATKNSATTLQIDPIGGSENFQGGSENFHER